MNRSIRATASALLVAATLGLAACATGPTITSDADASANFAQYRTFAFYKPLAIEADGYATLTSGRIKAAARSEMEARGYVYDETSPDLWLNLNAYMQRKTDVMTIPDVGYDYYYSYRRRAYFAVPYWREDAQVYRYTEGTLNVDLVDAKRNALVWTGAAVGRVSRSKSGQEDAKIDAAMAEIFNRYPYRAAGAGR